MRKPKGIWNRLASLAGRAAISRRRRLLAQQRQAFLETLEAREMFATVNLAVDPWISESSSSVPTVLTVSRTGDNTDSLSVGLAWSGTATNGVDYVAEGTSTSLPTSVTIAAGQSFASISIVPLDDAISEGNETVQVTLTEPSPSTAYSLGNSSASFSIADNDGSSSSGGTLWIEADRNSIQEGSSNSYATYTIHRDNTSGSVNVPYYFGGSASYGTDYTASNASSYGSITLYSGSSTATITIAAVDDSEAEVSELASLNLSVPSGYTIPYGSSSAGVYLYDNDSSSGGSSSGGTLWIEADRSSIQEGASNSYATYTIHRDSTSGSVDVYYYFGGSASFGSDYTAYNASSYGAITLYDGSSTATITIAAVDDTQAEFLELATLNLSAPSGYTIPYGSSSAEVYLYDNDSDSGGSSSSGTLWIDADRSSIQEGSSNSYATYTIHRDTTAGSVDVYYYFGGSASYGSDFTAYNASSYGTMTLYDGSSTATISIAAVDDNLAETLELASLNLSAPSGYTIPYGSSSAGVYLYDNDSDSGGSSGVNLWVDADRSSIQEGASDTATYTIHRNSTSGSVEVYYYFSGSAGYGSDYSASNGSSYGTATFYDGSSTATISIAAVDDNLVEAKEQADLYISSASGYSLLSSSATVTILSNDEPVLEVREGGSYSLPSGSGSLNFGATYTGAPATKVIQIVNSGGAPLLLGENAISLPAGFSLVSAVPAEILPGNSANVSLRLNADTEGSYSGQLTITSNDPDTGAYAIALQGTVIPYPPEIEVTIQPSTPVADGGTVSFGTTISGTAVTRRLNIHNAGGAPLTIDTAQVVVPTGFSLASLLPSTIAAGSTVWFDVQFDATQIGCLTGTLIIPNNDGDEGMFELSLMAESNPALAEISVRENGSNLTSNTTPIQFGVTHQGTPLSRSLVISNSGGVALNLDLANLSVPAGYSITHLPDASVSPGETTTLTVALTATSPGSYSGAIEIPSNDVDENPFVIQVTGTVQQLVGDLDVRYQSASLPASGYDLSFGVTVVDQPVGRTLTLANTGTAPLHLDVDNIVVPAGFAVTQAPTATLAVGATTSLLVQLTAATIGNASGMLVIPSDDPDESSYQIELSGEVREFLPEIAVTDGTQPVTDGVSTVNFGTLYTSAFANRTLTITNSGNGTLHLSRSSVTVPNGVTIATPFAEEVAAGESTTLVLQMQSTTARTITGTVSFTSDDPDESLFTFSIAGTVKTGVAEANVTSVRLTNDNGLPLDLISSDPRVDFIVDGAFSGNARLEFDHDGDGDVDGDVTLLVPGEAVTYDPRTSDATFVDFVGTVNLRYRIVFSGQPGDADSVSPWEIFSYTLEQGSPEIDVTTAENVTIADNVGLVEFGEAVVGTAVTQTLTIRNTGTASLLLDWANASIPAGYTLVNTPAASLAPTASAEVVLRLDANIAGSYHGALVVPTNDADENPFHIQLSGDVLFLSPQIDVRLAGGRRLYAQDAFNFGVTAVGTPLTRSFVIQNLGTQNLNLSSAASLTLPAGLELLNPWPATLAPQESATFQLKLTAAAVGEIDYALVIETNDPNKPTLELDVRGQTLPGTQTPPVAVTLAPLTLVHDTGVSATDWITYDANVRGAVSLSDALPSGSIVIDFDHNHDGITDGEVVVNLADQSFTYDLRAADPLLRNVTGEFPLYYRWRVLNGAGESIAIAADWSVQSIMLETPPWVDDLHVSDVGLVRNLTNDGTWSATDPSIYVFVSGVPETAQYALQFDQDGNGVVDHEVVAQSAAQEFVYDPREIDPDWRNAAAPRTIAYRIQTRNSAGQTLGTGAWQVFSFNQTALPASLLVPTLGLSQSTVVNGVTITNAPEFTGQAGGTQANLPGGALRSTVAIEFDFDNAGESVEATVSADDQLRYTYAPRLESYGAQSVRVRVKEWSPIHGDYLYSDWSTPFAFTYVAPPSPNVINLAFDAAAEVPTLTGQLQGAPATVAVEFDYDGDYSPDGFAVTDADGKFRHVPRGLTLGTSQTVRARSSVYDPRAAGFVFGAWSEVTFTPSAKSFATIDSSSFKLVEDTGSSNTDKRTTNPTLTGQLVDVANPARSLAGLTIEFQQSGTLGAAGFATTGSDGKFTYRPVGLVPDADHDQVLTARVVEWDAYSGTYVPGNWSTFAFRLEAPAAVPPHLIGLGQVRHASTTDGVHSDPAIGGQVVDSVHSTALPYATVQYRIDGATDEDGHEVIAGEVTADADGSFVIVPTGLALGTHTISIRTKEWNYATRTGLFGSWVDRTIQLAADNNLPAELTGLSVSAPAFNTWYGSQGGASDSSFAPLVLGTVSNTQGFAHVLVEFDQNNDGTADGIAQVDATGHFTYRPAGVTFGTFNVSARTLEWDRLTSTYLTSAWSPQSSFNFQPPNNSDPVVSNVTLTRRADGKLLLEGTVTDDQSAQNVLVAYRFMNYSTVIESQQGAVDSSGRFHLTFNDPGAGYLELYRQTTEINPSTGATTQSSWYYQAIPTIATGTVGSVVTNLHLTTDNGPSTDDRITSVGSISGQLVGSSSAGGTVYVNWNGSSADTITADSEGNFTWQEPANLTPGQRTVSFYTTAAAAWNSSSWVPFTYTVESPNVINAQIDSLELESGANGISPNGAVIGHVSGANGQPVTIQYRWGSESWTSGTVATAADGSFALNVNASSGGYVALRVRIKPVYESSSYVVGDEGWRALNFFVQSDPDSLESQALRRVMTRFDSSWQTAANQTAPVSPLLANALKQLGNNVYDYQQLQTQADRQRDTARAQAEATYNSVKGAADATRSQALATALTNFTTDLAAFTGDKTVLPLRDFAWPDAPQNVSHVIPADEDQPTAPAGPIYTGQDYNFNADTGYQDALASAEQVYNQTVKQAQDVYDAAEREAGDIYEAAKKLADQTLATALKQADEAYEQATKSGNNPYDLTAAAARRTEKKADADAALKREQARLHGVKEAAITAIDAQQYAESTRQLANEPYYYRAMYRGMMIAKPFTIAKAAAERAQQEGIAKAILKYEKAIHQADADYESVETNFNSYNRTREIAAAQVRDVAKALARKTHDQSLSTASATRDRALANAAETLDNAVAQADGTRWLQKAGAAVTSIDAWDEFAQSLWSEYQKTLIHNEADYVTGLVPKLVAQATADNATAKSAAIKIIDQREILEKAAADLVNVRVNADITDLVVYRTAASSEQTLREQRDSLKWQTYQDAKSTYTHDLAVSAAVLAEQLYGVAAAERQWNRGYWNLNPRSGVPGDKIESYADTVATIRESELAKPAYDAKHAADFTAAQAKAAARKTYEQGITASEKTYHEAIIPKYKAFLDKVAVHAETLAKDYAQKYVDYVKAVSGADKTASTDFAKHEKTAADGEVELAGTQTTADAEARGEFVDGVATKYQDDVDTWAESHSTNWGTYKKDLADLEVENVLATSVATAGHVAAIVPLSTTAAKEEDAHEEELSEEVATELDDETKSLADALLAYAKEVAEKRKTYAQGLNAAVALHDVDVVKANAKYQDARSAAFEVRSNAWAAADKTYENWKSDHQLAFYFDVDDSGDDAPFEIKRKELRGDLPAGSFNEAEDAWWDANDLLRKSHESALYNDPREAADAVLVSTLGAAYVTWNQELGTAHVALAQTAKDKADALADDLKKASDKLSESEADAAQDLLQGLAAAEKNYTTDEAQTADNLSKNLAQPDDTFSDTQGAIGDKEREVETSVRGKYEVGEFTEHQTKLTATPVPAGPASAWDGYQRNIAQADVAQNERDAAARNTFEKSVSNHYQAQRAADVPTGGNSADLNHTNALAGIDQQYSDNIAAAEATIEKSTASAASLAAKTGIVAENQLDLKVALAQQTYDNTVAAAEATYWNALQTAFNTFSHDRRVHGYQDAAEVAQANQDAINATWSAAVTAARNTRDAAVQQARAAYAQAIGAGKVERSQTQGDALATYSASVNAATGDYLGSVNSAEDAQVAGERGAETTYTAANIAKSAAGAVASRSKSTADATALGNAQLALTTALANSAATAAHDTAQAEATFRTTEFTSRKNLAAGILTTWTANQYTPTTLERWLVSMDQAEANWQAAIAPAFVTYASNMADAAAAETIAQAASAKTQSLANLAADNAYQAATDSLFAQAQEDQLDAWYDYLEAWYDAEHTDSVAQLAAQTAFDVGDSAAATQRLVAFDQADTALVVNYINSGHEAWSENVPDYVGRSAADIAYATARGSVDSGWSLGSGSSTRTRQKSQADYQHTYESRIAEINRDLELHTSAAGRTRDIAIAATSTAYWTAITTAANANRTAEYAAQAELRTAVYAFRADALAELANDFPLPWVEYQSLLANAREGWWNSVGETEFLAIGADRNEADSDFVTAYNTAYTQWASATYSASNTYSNFQANNKYSEAVGNSASLRQFQHAQADAAYEYQTDYADTTRHEYERITEARHQAVLDGNYTPYADYEPTLPGWDYGWNSPYNQQLLDPHNKEYTQAVVPADGARRIQVIQNHFTRLNGDQLAQLNYITSAGTAESQFQLASTGAENARARANALSMAQHDAAGAAAWANTLNDLVISAASPWLVYEAAVAAADSVYQSTMIIPQADYIEGLSAAEGAAAVAAVNATWNRSVRDAIQQFQSTISSDSSAFHNDMVSALGTTTNASFSTLGQMHGPNGSVPTILQVANYSQPSGSTNAGPAAQAQNRPTPISRPTSFPAMPRLRPLPPPADIDPIHRRSNLRFREKPNRFTPASLKQNLSAAIAEKLSTDAKKLWNSNFWKADTVQPQVADWGNRVEPPVTWYYMGQQYTSAPSGRGESITREVFDVKIGNLMDNDWVAIDEEFGGGRTTLRALQILAAKLHVGNTSNPIETIKLAIASIRSPFTIVDGANSSSLGIFLDGTGNHLESVTNTTRMYNVYGGSKFYYGGVGNFIDWADDLPGRESRPMIFRGEFLSGNSAGYGWQEILRRAKDDIEEYFNNYATNHPELTEAPIESQIQIDIFGFSRGAAMANELARWLQEEGIHVRGVRIHPTVRFLGMFDPVYSMGGPGQASALVKSHRAQSESSLGEKRTQFDNTVGATIPSNVQSVAVLAAMHEERTYFPATIFESESKNLVVGSNFHQIALPGAHCEVGGHYTSTLQNQRLSFYTMVELARRAGVPIGDGSTVDPQLQAHFASPFRRLLGNDGKRQYNSYGGVDHFAEQEEDLADSQRRATFPGQWLVPTKEEIETLLKAREAKSWRPAAIGVQIESNPARSWISYGGYRDATVDLFDGNNDTQSEHWERRLPRYSYPSSINPEWSVYNAFFQELDKLRSKANGEEGFEQQR